MRIGTVALRTNLLLAPIAGYCDLAFRRVVRSCDELDAGHGFMGVGMTCTDLLCPQALLAGGEKSQWLAARSDDDEPLCMQLYGADAGLLADAARWAQDHGASVIDINMGCPVDKVTKKNGGSMLLCDPAGTVRLAQQVVRAVSVPVTAKIRLGWDEERLITRTLPPALVGVGIAAITVHGRTTQQMFRGEARLVTPGADCIRAVVEAVKSVSPDTPVIGNGDVRTPADAERMLTVTGCDGVMIGRGALGQPWVFRDTAWYLRTGELPEPFDRERRIACVRRHFHHLLHYRGLRVAINTIRQRMSWYSPHMQPWPGVRQRIREVETVEQFETLMAEGVREGESQVKSRKSIVPSQRSVGQMV